MPECREIMEINNGEYRARINLSEGANCICLESKAFGADILRQPNYSVGIDNPFLYGIPILFPVNRISGGKFIFENREYAFPINEPETGCHLHGELYKKKFILSEKTESSAVCIYSSLRERNGFPHRYSVVLKYNLLENGLLITTEIINNSSLNMPVLLGFHTTLNIPFLKGSGPNNIFVSAEIGDEIERDGKTYLSTGKIITDSRVNRLFNSGKFKPCNEKISLHYKANKGGKIIITDTVNNASIIYENDSKFGWRLFYNGNADEYICLEPQSCMVDCKNSGFPDSYTGFDYIEPFSKKAYFSSIKLNFR